MIIKQEETNPVSDIFYGTRVNEALNLVKEASEDLAVDTDYLKEVCETTITMLRDYLKKIEDLEKKELKNNAKNRVLERLQRGHENE